MNKGRVVEFGDARRVMSDPQHEYTRLLLDSIPTTRGKWRTARPPAPAPAAG